ncbi:metal-dependent hydrolase [Halobacterium jilantaiense]|uniref:LexA-binding, inner membrane-associated putative hydrolase n=1 Tax=Halobacterium jilantaiense TaxID=355548 RepID=A0A1I0QPL8_9EURY|nr:metal-dependent hydrolase [Halobacterium jilantaiense]SEW29416.1 LexA-binding, inner membrane-associated putative hydrolase [Halobacterium jilantaiense]
MFVGHATAAFGAVALLALFAGVSRRRAAALAVTAGLFAAVPDVDMAYALVGLVGVDPTQPLSAANSFWGASTVVHRGVTHSLAVALPAAAAFALAPTRRRTAAGVLAALVAVVFAVSGPVAAAVAALFAAFGWMFARFGHAVGVRGRSLLAVAAVGLASHPFGDLLTGEPPALLYPLDVVVFGDTVVLSADPTLHLLGAFGVELAAIWLGVLGALAIADLQVREFVDYRAAAGAAYALAVVAVPAPTLDTSYQFVFSVLAVGTVGVTPKPTAPRTLPGLPSAAITGLAAVTVAGVAYAVAYAAGVA